MKKIISLLMTLLVLVALTVTVGTQKAAAATGSVTDVGLSVTYGQTEARSMLKLINEFRTGDEAWYWNETDTKKVQVEGLQPLEYSYELEKIAMQRAAEIALSFSHTRPNGQRCFSLGNFNGENIAAGRGSAAYIMELWKETEYSYSGQGHRRNMLEKDFTHVGIGHVYVNGIHYWVQDFGVNSSVGASTAANDTVAIVTIAVADGDVISFKLTDDAISLSPNESKTVSPLTGTLYMTETWPYGATVTVKPAWTVADSSVASLQNGTLKALAPGNTAINATIFGKAVSIPVSVACTNHVWGPWQMTKEADCTHEGSRSHSCSVCGKTESEAVKALGHVYQEKVTAATCTEKGYTTYTCTRCGDSYKDKYTNTKPHTWGLWQTTKEADCTHEGSRSHSCSVCGKTESEAVKALGHAYQEKVTAATCTEKGYTTYTCTRCGDSYKDNYTNTKPHTWGSWTVKEVATCTKSGSRSHTCTACGATETESIDKTAHTYANGKCTVCGAADPGYTPPSETTPPVTEPATTTPPTTEPTVTEPATTTPPTTEPEQTEPVTTTPPTTEPDETEPEQTEPVETEPNETEPTATEPDEAQPTQTESTETGTMESAPIGDIITSGKPNKGQGNDSYLIWVIAAAGVAVVSAAAAIGILVFLKRRRKE